MKRELLSKAVGGIDESYVLEAYRPVPEGSSGGPERIIPVNRKRILTVALAAALVLALGIGAFAAWSIHMTRQKEVKSDLNIEGAGVTGYVEYDVPKDDAYGLVLLSSVNDGQEEHVYLNISPVSEEEAAAFPDAASYAWSIRGTDIGGFAAPQLPVGTSLSGPEEIRETVLNDAYDKETQTMTLRCFLDVDMLKDAQAKLGTETVPLQIHMMVDGEEERIFGPVTFAMTAEQSRTFDFGNVRYHDRELDRDIEIVGLELTPFSAVWKVRYEGAEEFHTPEADWEAYEPWGLLEEKVCTDSVIVFSDGSTFSTGGALTCPYENGTVNQYCSWGRAIDIHDILRIELNGLVLWKAE